MQEYEAAMKMFPNNLEMKYWTAITLANNGNVAKAAKLLKSVYAKDPLWRELTKRLPKSGVLTVKEEEMNFC
nr:tetratricopeptide repeat protein [Haliscomenobacter sp.]